METKAELEAKHGTPKQFEEACKKAWTDGYVTFQEAVDATEKYEKEYADAPANNLARIEKQIKSIICICGQIKQKSKPFCRKCFLSLPDDLKGALSNQLLEDFVTAYATARDRLRSR